MEDQLVKELVKLRQEVTELEPERKQTMKLLRTLADRSTVGIYIVQDGKFRFVNSVFRDYVGYSAEELLGMNSLSLVCPEDRDMVRQNAVEMLKGKRYLPYEFRYMSKSGDKKWVIEAVVSIPYQGKQAAMGSFMDITERNQAEEALKSSKERFQALIENAFDTIMIINADGSVGYVSPSIKQSLGYEPEEWIGKNLFDFTHPDDLQKVIDLYNKEIQDPSYAGYTGFMEVRAKHKDGSWRIIETVSTNLLHHPSVAGIVSNFRDVTDYRQKEKNYRELIEDINDGYIVYQDDKIVLANQKFAEIFGYEVDQVLGQTFMRFIASDAIAEAVELYVKAESGKEDIRQYELNAVKGDGTEIIIDLSSKAIEYNGKHAYSIIFRDITERRQMEEKYRHLLEDMKDGYGVLQDGKIVFANERFSEIFGYEPGQVLGHNMTEFIAPDGLQEIMELYAKVIKYEEEVPEGIEVMGIKKNGTLFPIHGGVKQIEYEGKLAHSVIIRDVTEQKKAEQRLQELYEQEIKLREALEEEKKIRTEFTRVLVHELRTPLTPVMAASEFLVEELQEGNLKRLAKNISQGASNLNNRINDLLDLVKGEVGTLQLNFVSVDLLLLLHELADNIIPMASSNGHSLILDLPQSLPQVQADVNRLQQVMLNLFNNASKFTPDGGKITLRARKNGNTLIVEVQDTGKGISEEEQQRLFEPYYRVESDRQRLSGLGLGLALCKTLVELHGGQIWVESRLGEGSTFGFSLPLEASQGRG